MEECNSRLKNVFEKEDSSRKIGYSEGFEINSESCGCLGGTPR